MSGFAGAEEEPVFHIVLVEPEIPPNTGSIGRLCLGTRCRLHLVKPLGFSLDEKAVRRAGLDYWKHVDLVVHERFEDLLIMLEGARYRFTSARYGIPYAAHAYARGDVFVFGRESVGLPDQFHQQYPDQFIRIPTIGPIRSLNLSNAASIIVYEGLRQIQPELFDGTAAGT